MLRTLRLLHEIASPSERRHFAFLILALAVAALLETASVAIVFPFVAAVTDPSVVDQSSPGRIVLDLLGAAPGPESVLPLGLLTLAVVLVSAAVSAATTWYLNRFMWGWLHSLSSRLLLQYLRQSYAFFLGRNTAELAKNLLHEVDTAVNGAVVPTMLGLARGFVAIGLVTLLLILEPVIAIGGLLVVGTSYTLIYVGSRGRQGALGQRRLELNDQRHRQASETLGGIKTVKVFGRESVFLERYDWLSSGYARATGSRQIIASLPKNFVEAVAVGGGLLLVLVLISQGRPAADVLPIVGVFAFAGYKLLPAVQQLFFTATNARFYLPAIERLHADLGAPAEYETGSPGDDVRLPEG
ncbi:MAG: ABC transporter transmembrane domain-containing protein, partial [Longimicrobiales bacterium]|nr:ABC transporter transmembrane domain-containing protein [Longimicrobiales bacterium]